MNTSFDPKRFREEVEKRIRNKDYKGLFEGGCCYHFVYIGNKLLNWPIHSLIDEFDHRVKHVYFVPADKMAFDWRGHRDIQVLLEDWSGCYPSNEPVSLEYLKEEIRRKLLPARLLKKVFKIADSIIKKQTTGYKA